MRIAVDMDGVLADFDKGWIDAYNEDFPSESPLKYKHIQDWDALLTLTHFKNYNEWWHWAQTEHHDLFLNLEPLPGAVRGVQHLSRQNDICIVTSKPRWAAGHPVDWLEKHKVPFDELHIMTKKWFLKCDVYIDDAEHNCRDFLYLTNGHVIQYSAFPYVNGGRRFFPEDTRGFSFATDWDEVIDIVRKVKV